jgi:hypothetical protein
MYRCIDCGGPVEEHMVEAVTNPTTGKVDLELILCESCDTSDSGELFDPGIGSDVDDVDGFDWNDDSDGYDY